MLFFLAFWVTVALAIWFLICSEASLRAKIIVGLWFTVSVLLRHSRFSLAGFFMWVSLGIFIAVYHKVQTV